MTYEELSIGTAISSWKLAITRLDQMFSSLRDKDLQREVAPGRNRVFYLLGHLTVAHDRLFPILGLGDRLHPELDEDFFTNPDRTFPEDDISATALRQAWSEVNSKLTADLVRLRPEQWMERQSAVSDEGFAKDPLRNRLALLISRTNHASFHAGQIRLAS
ncbi:DinB family protein [Granulicella sp. S156]|uniref:DinB family protein n=1 Tax=Granulicella sp. S156 TaxID=1747224 RepID=UPI00131B09FE|nr:DinB family protein [Granulicella sp. S156]